MGVIEYAHNDGYVRSLIEGDERAVLTQAPPRAPHAWWRHRCRSWRMRMSIAAPTFTGREPLDARDLPLKFRTCRYSPERGRIAALSNLHGFAGRHRS